ncbi:hypothetical protein RDI58_030721 [Solanum bulbocastanum]|uniref:Uncharacterized protein n=1 Tax=Solanum bulbocastanum TaxID=147425 RepID=A0AAN8SNS9_SOLBU
MNAESEADHRSRYSEAGKQDPTSEMGFRLTGITLKKGSRFGCWAFLLQHVREMPGVPKDRSIAPHQQLEEEKGMMSRPGLGTYQPTIPFWNGKKKGWSSQKWRRNQKSSEPLKLRSRVTRASSSTPFPEDRGNLASDKVVADIGIAGKGRASAKILTYLETRFAAPADSSFEESDSLTLEKILMSTVGNGVPGLPLHAPSVLHFIPQWWNQPR